MLRRYQKYLDFRKKYSKYWGYTGNFKNGEIEILDDVSLFPLAEKSSAKIMMGLGISKTDAEERSLIGVHNKNRWGVVVSEPVKTPTGDLYVYARFISWAQLENGFAGIVIVPKLEDGRFVFIKTFRNATRSWCLEFPRGMKDPDKDISATIIEEVEEETGAEIIGKPKKIGEIEPDDGCMNAKVLIYEVLAKISKKINLEVTEAIDGLVFLKKSEIKKILKTQKYTDKKGKTYSFKDGFTLSALQLLGV